MHVQNFRPGWATETGPGKQPLPLHPNNGNYVMIVIERRNRVFHLWS